MLYGSTDPDHSLAIMLCDRVKCLVQVNISWPVASLLLTKSISLCSLASLALDRALKLRIAWIWKLRCCWVRREITESTSIYDRRVSENHSYWLRIPDIVSIATSRDSEEWIVCRAKSWSNGKLGSCCTVRRRFWKWLLADSLLPIA